MNYYHLTAQAKASTYLQTSGLLLFWNKKPELSLPWLCLCCLRWMLVSFKTWIAPGPLQSVHNFYCFCKQVL